MSRNASAVAWLSSRSLQATSLGCNSFAMLRMMSGPSIKLEQSSSWTSGWSVKSDKSRYIFIGLRQFKVAKVHVL